MKPKVGNKIKTWFSGQADGMSTILEVRKYNGAYPQWFKWVVTLTAPGTWARQIEMVV